MLIDWNSVPLIRDINVYHLFNFVLRNVNCYFFTTRRIFIPKFNNQFGVVAKKKSNLHRKLNEKQRIELERILSIQSERSINNDYTIRFKNNYYQLKEIQPTTVYKRDKVIIEERLNRDLKITLRDKYLDYFKLPNRPKKEIEIKLVALTKTKPINWVPPFNHPWRKQFLENKRQPTSIAER